MAEVILDELGVPLPAWMQDYLVGVLAQPRQPVQRAPEPPPLALKMCAGCTAQYAVEGDVGDEQGGTTWFGPCCPTPVRYADVFIREASYRMDGPGYCQCRTVYPPGSGPQTPGRLMPCHLHREEVPVAESPNDGDWAAEIAAWLAETSTCTRCSEPLVRFEALIGAWLTAGEVDPPRVRGLCPGGETHTAGEVQRDSRFANPEAAATAAGEDNGNAPH